MIRNNMALEIGQEFPSTLIKLITKETRNRCTSLMNQFAHSSTENRSRNLSRSETCIQRNNKLLQYRGGNLGKASLGQSLPGPEIPQAVGQGSLVKGADPNHQSPALGGIQEGELSIAPL